MSDRRHYLRTTAASALAFALLLPACADSPTQVIEVESLEGLWQLSMRANISCNANALARTINFSLDTVNVGDGVDRFQGVWDPGAPLIVGAGYSGEFDPETRQLTMSFDLTGIGRVLEFTGVATRSDRMNGTILPGPQPIWDVGTCEQTATARKVGL